MMLKRLHLIGTVALLMAFGLIGANNLCAAVVSCPPASTPETLAFMIANFNSLANACSIQDKLFWNFSYTSLGTSAPPASNVTVDPISGPNITGFNFSATWAGTFASPANFILSYTVEVCPVALVPPCTPPNGFSIIQADAVYSPSSLFGASIENVMWTPAGVPGTVTLTSLSPGPMANVFPGVPGPITVLANWTGIGDITQTTLRFYEGVVPESATMVLMGIGLAGLGIIRRRRCS